MDGILVINKPKGVTSHDVVDIVRRELRMKKVGHAGTLDPMATGVLVILVGRSTKLFDKFLTFDKEYVATLTLGARTTTGDSQGEVLESKDFSHVTKDMLEEVMKGFVGKQMQVPPMVSAVKHKGKRLYALARKGVEVKRQARSIDIKDLRLLDFVLPHIKFYLRCSRGTYVRKLAEDIAVKLDCLGFVSQIERQSVGRFTIENSIPVERIKDTKPQLFIA